MAVNDFKFDSLAYIYYQIKVKLLQTDFRYGLLKVGEAEQKYIIIQWKTKSCSFIHIKKNFLVSFGIS